MTFNYISVNNMVSQFDVMLNFHLHLTKLKNNRVNMEFQYILCSTVLGRPYQFESPVKILPFISNEWVNNPFIFPKHLSQESYIRLISNPHTSFHIPISYLHVPPSSQEVVQYWMFSFAHAAPTN